MLFVSEYNSKQFGLISLAWGFVQKREDGYNIISLPQMLTDPNIQRMLTSNKNMSYTLSSFKGIVLPTLIEESDFNDNDFILNLYSDLIDDDGELHGLELLYDKTLNTPVLQELLDCILDFLPLLTLDELKGMIVDAVDCLDTIYANDFKYIIDPMLPATTIKYLTDYNNSSNGQLINYTNLKTKTTKAVPMVKETDEIFFTIPKPYFVNDIEEMNYETQTRVLRIWNELDLIKPYGKNIKLSPTALDFKEVLKGLDSLVIFGNDANNELPLQKNEESFYNALNKYIEDMQKLICEETGESDKLELYESICKPKRDLKRILDALLRVMVNINWRHSPLVPLKEITQNTNLEDDNDSSSDGASEDDGSGEAKQDIVDSNEYAEVLDEHGHSRSDIIDYVKTIEGFMTANNCSIYAYSEMIIRLARWGSMKPSAIILNFPKSNSANKYYLDTLAFKSYLNDKVIDVMVKNFEGKPYILSGIITTPERGIDLNVEPLAYKLLDIPEINIVPHCIIGIQCIQQIMKGGVIEPRVICMDLIEVIKMYKEDKSDIVGLELDSSGEFKVSSNLVSKILKNKFYINNAINVINSKDKSRFKFINNNYDFIKTYPQLTKEDLKYTNMVGFADRLNHSNKIGPIMVINDDIMNIAFRPLVKPLMTYFSELNTIKVVGDEILDLELSLNCLNDIYKGNEITEFKGYKIQETEKTSLFGKPEEQKELLIKPANVYIVQNDLIFLIQTSEDATVKLNNCDYTLKKYNEDMGKIIFDNKNAPKGIEAVRNLLMISLDTAHETKIYCDSETLESIDNIRTKFYKGADASKLITIINAKLEQAKK